jgi:hypothetical protein
LRELAVVLQYRGLLKATSKRNLFEGRFSRRYCVQDNLFERNLSNNNGHAKDGKQNDKKDYTGKRKFEGESSQEI